MYEHVSKLTKRYGDRMFAGDDATKRFVKNAVYAGTKDSVQIGVKRRKEIGQ